MTARGGDWPVVGQDRDPVPGDESDVQALADGYARAADDIDRLASRLRRLADLDGWRGEAAETFAETADDTAGDLAKAEARYRQAATALRGWVGPVRRARAETWQALTSGTAARDDVRRYSVDLLAGVAEPTPEQLDAQRRYDQLRVEAERRLAQARTRLTTALAELDAAGQRTAEALRDAGEKGKDRWWDNVKGKVRDISTGLKQFVDVLGYVAMGLAAITVFVAMIATAPAWLIGLGIAVGVTMLATHVALVVSESGKATYADVGMDLLSLIPGGYALRLTGRIQKAVPLLRGRLAQSYDDVARAAAARLERAAPRWTNAVNASRISDTSNSLRRWADDYLHEAGKRVDDAAAAARSFVEDGAVRTSTLTQRLQHLDRETAEAASEVQRLMQAARGDDAILLGLRDVARDVRHATGAAWTGLTAQVADSTDQLASREGGPEILRWKDDLAQGVANRVWRLEVSHR